MRRSSKGFVSSPERLLAAIVLAGAAMACREPPASGDDDTTGDPSDSDSGSELTSGGTATSAASSGAETSTSTGPFTTGPSFDLGSFPDSPDPEALGSYWCCEDDEACLPDEVCTTGLWPDDPLLGLCTPTDCGEIEANCPLGDGGDPTPMCINDPPVCVLGCTTDEDCPWGTSCWIADGDSGYCVQCVQPIF
jgi:hypothetical protein